jgi:endonuclease YncB( thermonuclease family)
VAPGYRIDATSPAGDRLTFTGARDDPVARQLWQLMSAILVGLLVATSGIADQISGRASVIDGDTLEIHGIRIRLWGIDAPESTQLCRGDDSLQYRCGAKAANDVDAFIALRPVTCSAISLDQYGRTVADCSVGGIDLGEWLVSNGLALDWPRYSHGKYEQAQRRAKQAERGIWAGSFTAPWLYRACIKASGTPSRCSDGPD